MPTRDAMKTIYKYTIPRGKFGYSDGPCELLIPDGAQFLHTGLTKYGVVSTSGRTTYEDRVTVWFLVDTSAKEVRRSFYVIQTGVEVPKGVAYLGTVIAVDDVYVFHLFEGHHA